MTVVDASVLVAAVADAGPEGRWAEQVVGRGELVAPHLALVEAANILRRLELAGRLTRLESSSGHRDLLDLQLDLLPYEPFADRVWALRHGITAYDALYVAIAEAIDAPLATLDRRLTRAPGLTCRFELPPA